MPNRIALRQSNEWAEFMRKIGWHIEEVEKDNQITKIFIKRIPLIGSVIKIHRPTPPLPFEEFDQIAQKYRALFVKIQPNISKEQGEKLIKQLEDSGYGKDTWPLIPTKTIQIDLTQARNTLFSSMSKDARYSIRRAQRNGVNIEISHLGQGESKNEVDKFYSLLKKRGKERSFQVQKRKEFNARINTFGEKVFLVLAYNSSAKELIAGAQILIYDDIGYYLQAASNETGRKRLASYLVMWESIKLTEENHCTTFDLEGTYDPRYSTFSKWKDFTVFKKKFGGKEITYIGAFIKYYNKFFRSLSQYAP